MVALLPKHVEASNSLDDLTDEELAIIAELLLAEYGDPRTRRKELPSPRFKCDGQEAPTQRSEEAFSPKQHAALEQSRCHSGVGNEETNKG
jgi:hypothetical protein